MSSTVGGSWDPGDPTGSGHSFELGTDGPRAILVGVDGSDTSLRAGAYAAGLARRQGARLIELFVVGQSPAAAQLAASAALLRQTQDEIEQELRTNLADASHRLGLDTEFVRREGNPYRELVAVAHERRVDAVVVGASSQAGHRFVGSLAGRLVRDAAWPITVVP